METAETERSRAEWDKVPNKDCENFHMKGFSLVVIAILFFLVGYFLGNSGSGSTATVTSSPTV